MKKALVLVLAVVLVMSMAVPAYAAVSPTAPTTNTTTTSPLPEMVDTGDNPYVKVELVPVEDATKLTPEAQEVYAEAQKTLAEATPDEMKVMYFCYVTIEQDGSEEKIESVSLTIKIDNVKEIVVKQYIDGEWVELEVINNLDGTFTIKGVKEGPIAIFVK